jgi:hypothetical protein
LLSTDVKLTIGNFTKTPARWLHHRLGSATEPSRGFELSRTASSGCSSDVALVPHPDAGNPVLTGADVHDYCHQVRLSRLTSLSPSIASFEEHPASPILAGTGGLGWNSGRMHHVDPHSSSDGWLCAVDGDIGFGRGTWTTDQWSIGIYTAVERQALLREDGSGGS